MLTLCPAAHRARTPETCGVAIDVPDSTCDAVTEAMPAEMMPVPGAKTLTQAPQLEYHERRSSMSDAATDTTEASLAGDMVHASAFELPAATA